MYETSTFTSTVTGETFTINHKFDYITNMHKYVRSNSYHAVNVSYDMLVRQKDQFRSKWNNNESDFRKYSRGGSCMQQHLFNNLCTPGHAWFLDEASTTFIDKTDPSDPLKTKDYCRRTLKTMAPFGRNIKESV